ncbi:MAG: tRNA 2-thiouridine(34) synthase MnmA [Lachnospiraceae bacterium]|nr:tRNA 2-thiouridine(34) synthase MnmA [Lachnospiraceae bacterium]
MAKKVVIGMSGGVDSSVAAYLLKKQGYDVIGVTMEMWRDAPEVCEDGIEAKKVADQIGIPHVIMHFKPEFESSVVQNFIDEYLCGRTPNPCVMCNRCIKWQALMNRGAELGADYVATGHYARVEQLPNGRYAVRNSKAAAKDQTYVLCQLTQDQLAHTIMPLGEFESKDEIRKIASGLGLVSADKKDSQDVCFIDDDYGTFLETRLGKENLPGPGDFVWKDGTVVGKHQGITHYTIGQRKGLNIALGKPVFVQKIDVPNNRVILCDNDDLFVTELTADTVNLVSEEVLDPNKEYIGKIRYSDKGTPCHASLDSDVLTVKFERPVRAVTPGQTLVLYDGEYVAAGALIQ